jgi:hypothetical protein
MKKNLLTCGLVLTAIVMATCTAKKDIAQSKPNESLGARTIITLASDEYEGRQVGTEGEKKAAALIQKEFAALNLKPMGTDGDWLQNFKFVPHGGMQKHQVGDSTVMGMQLVKEVSGNNVVGYLDNGAANTIVIGAHYDHLGWGDENSLWTGTKAIHNGADDNASGVGALLEIATFLSKKNKTTTSNNYLFIAFSGEEKGLWGSNYFIKNPTIDLTKVNYMLNMDMVGRLNAEKTLAVYGVGTSPEWKELLPKIKIDDIKIITTESGVGPSDHTSFYLADIPVLHFFTGQHEDYHKPTDDSDKINYVGLNSVIKYIEDVIVRINDKGKIGFTKTKDENTATAADFKVTLGVMPDYMYSDKGLRIDGVKEGRPGQKAGLIKGDTVIKIGDYPVDDIYQYMEALGKFEKGQSADMLIIRNGAEMVLKVVWE